MSVAVLRFPAELLMMCLSPILHRLEQSRNGGKKGGNLNNEPVILWEHDILVPYEAGTLPDFRLAKESLMADG